MMFVSINCVGVVWSQVQVRLRSLPFFVSSSFRVVFFLFCFVEFQDLQDFLLQEILVTLSEDPTTSHHVLFFNSSCIRQGHTQAVALDVYFTTGVHCLAAASQLKTHGFNVEYRIEHVGTQT